MTHTAGETPAWAEQLGIRMIRPGDDEWPATFVGATDAGSPDTRSARPATLWARGTARLGEALARSITIVGSHRAGEYGERVAREFAADLAANGVTVASGAASGIGAWAHRASLDAGGMTVAVVGFGLGVRPPTATVDLLHRISDRGVVVSEFGLNAAPTRLRYLRRCALLAALSQGTVLVEAAVRTGAHQTATKAAALGKPVMAVPGQITAPEFSACHAMLRAGTATLVTSAADVAETVGQWKITHVAAREKAQPEYPSSTVAPQPVLTDEQQLVHRALATGAGKSSEQAAEDAGLPLLRTRAVLAELELDGITERCESGWRRKPDELPTPHPGG